MSPRLIFSLVARMSEESRGFSPMSKKGITMSKMIIETDQANKNPINSQGVKKNNVLFTSQKAAIDPAENRLIGIGDIKAQTERVIRNILAIVEAGGGAKADLVKINVYLKNKEELQDMNEVYRQFFPDELPARSLILSTFVDDRMLLEMDAVAIVG
jgi:reactive intermediate/imine deaminase